MCSDISSRFTTMIATMIWPTLCSRSSMLLILSHAGFCRSPWLNLVLDRKSSNDPRPNTRHTMPSRNLSSAPTAAVTSSTGLKCTHAMTPSKMTSLTPMVNSNEPSMSVAHTPSSTNPPDMSRDSLTKRYSAWLNARYLVEIDASLSPARSCRFRFIFLANFFANFFSSMPAALAAAARFTSATTHLRGFFVGVGSAFPVAGGSSVETLDAAAAAAASSRLPAVTSSAFAFAASGSALFAAASVATSSTSCRTSSTSTAPNVSVSSSSSSRTSSSTVASSSSSSASSLSASASSMISWTAARCCSRSARVSSARSASFAAARAAMSSFSFFSRISASLASRSSSTRRFASARVASGSASGSRKNLSTLSCAFSQSSVARAAAASGSEVDTFPLGESAARTSALASSAAASRLRCGTHRAMRTRRSLPPQRYPPTEGFISTRREPVDGATRA
mmetsp:Transcript_2709/g.10604  ORF Transcript_2709/g.10604 Transcript_2709/m.10604 type:complete len:451 (-) Transcript_2709:261-1613(-)